MIREGIGLNSRICDKVAEGGTEEKFVYSCTDDGVIDGDFACPCVAQFVVVV